MTDLSKEDLDRLYEASKLDHYGVVGSEVRQMIGMIRRSADAVFLAKVDAAHVLAAKIRKNKQLAARIEALEAALRERDEKLVIYHAFLSEAFPNGAKLNFSVDDLEKARAALAPEQDK